ncbi:MAG: hypothetical protein AAB688_00410 [Patescibacteria group bacterium]
MAYIKTGPDDNNSQLNLKKREEDKRKKELEEGIKKEKEKKEKQAILEKSVIQTKLANKKRLLFLKKQDEEKLEREIGIVGRDLKVLKTVIENEKSGSENIQTKLNAEKHKLTALMGIINEKTKEQDRLKGELSELEKNFGTIKENVKKGEYEIILKKGVSPSEKEEERRESEKKRLMQQISILQQEERLAAQEVAGLEGQLKNFN